MNDYESIVYDEILAWRNKIFKRSGLLNRMTKKAQMKINHMIPEKAHMVIRESINGMVQATLTGSNLISKKQFSSTTLYEKDKVFHEKLSYYRKMAVMEGAGTGVGGILLGLADFPLLLSIKMKFLYEVAAVYGFDVKSYEERLFILHIFQLAFSNEENRKNTFYILENWETEKEAIVDMDWQVFQQEYRDYIDFVKMLQLIPGFGAIVGAYANHNLLDQLGEAAKNIYRMRILN